ncbi:glycoside hydrolase family 26 protein [Gonapodya prolifera JEL478]|uniref:Glycoside hydrolase family 26 protein n=1 Tax=Gonapodya prolifera (strain JEL478) TaxID=1344416 RepID=A0A139AXW7_GONPJ|nr:glycoside hydrolase family 26 protein [Gonapodya prolifera JEL478]|eukprot:KXS21586.1 glycoside hydrolase family 26 protein [Gonapodya prolifera JEL478]
MAPGRGLLLLASLLCVAVNAQNLTFPPVPPPTPGMGGSNLTANPFPAPSGNGVYLGATLDWDVDSPANLSTRLGVPLLTYSIFLKFPLTDIDKTFLNKTVKTEPYPSLGADGQTKPSIMVTLEPSSIEALSDATFDDPTVLGDVVDMVRDLNAKGLYVLLRFGHEMNGWWYAWCMRPIQYKKTFRRVGTAVKSCAECSATAMLWAPQIAISYPWGLDIPLNDTTFFTRNPDYANLNLTELQTLDTNGDGKISLGDEPYAPYYPGDDIVDWVGISIYFNGKDFYGQNSLPTPNTFLDNIRGIDVTSGTLTAPDFYQIYSVQKGKPFALAETSANWNAQYAAANPNSTTMLQMKQAWWRETLSDRILDAMPNYRASFTFEFRKMGEDIKTVTFDYGYTTTPEVAAAFLADLPKRFLLSNGTFTSLNLRQLPPAIGGSSFLVSSPASTSQAARTVTGAATQAPAQSTATASAAAPGTAGTLKGGAGFSQSVANSWVASVVLGVLGSVAVFAVTS